MQATASLEPNKIYESGTEIGNFGEIRFRRPTSAQLSRAVKAELSAHFDTNSVCFISDL